MASSEVSGITPEAMIQEFEDNPRRSSEIKFAFQVGLKNLDMDAHPRLPRIIQSIIR